MLKVRDIALTKMVMEWNGKISQQILNNHHHQLGQPQNTKLQQDE